MRTQELHIKIFSRQDPEETPRGPRLVTAIDEIKAVLQAQQPTAFVGRDPGTICGWQKAHKVAAKYFNLRKPKITRLS